jgi:phage-related baseplate assembly protein
MSNIRSVNEIILSMIDFLKLAQPNLSTVPGSVGRDLMIDLPASQLSLLYDELSGVSNKQSLRLVTGSDLDKLAKNYGLSRNQSTPSSGPALITFSSINAPIAINTGATVAAKNGYSFSVLAGTSVLPASINYYKSIASKYRAQLDFAGISDQYAVQVTVQATSAGSSGNIGTYSLSVTNIPGTSHVTNVVAFTGGLNQETDASFRNRILSSFSGSSVGTALGYLNVALSVTGVSDATVIEPGDPLMVRDGTVISVASDGTRTIVSEGSGGKVDVVALGSNLIQGSDSYIYQDKSNNNDPTNSKNDLVLGQITADANKTVNRKRIDDIAAGVLPAQPVENLIQVIGSLSGSNFAEQSIDSYGRVSGNYKLIKDTGVYGGSPFGFDTFHWISNKISLLQEDKVKGQVNSQDATAFKDVLEVPQAQQTITITNENSTVTSDRSIIQLLHTPATSVTRVFNVNTGERYVITSQNLDQTGTYNTTGRIQISGNTLPSPSDLLQVDYNWIVNFDQYSDYDGLQYTSNPRTATDCIDWGLSSAIKNERVLFTLGNNFFTGTASHPISSIISAKKFTEINGKVQQVSSGTFINRLSVTLIHLPVATTSIDSITFKNSTAELYNTAQANGIFTVTTEVVGIKVLYITTIILPTDTVAVIGDNVSVIINSSDTFYSTSGQGSSSGTQITIPSTLVNTTANNITLLVTYNSSVNDLISTSTTSLPASRLGNGYILSNNSGFSNFSITNCSIRENQVVQKNLSNQYYIDLSLPSSDFTLLANQIISVVRLSDGYELCNSNHLATITTGSTANYQLILSGFNAPAISDRVLVIYNATDIRRFQPYSYSNNIIKKRIDRLSVDGNNNFTLPINRFVNQSSLTFTVIEPNTDIVLFTGSDGYIVDNGNGTANFSSLSVNFSSQVDIFNKKIKIVSGSYNCLNDAIYDITIYNPTTNVITITNILNKLNSNQISVVRVADGQELWNYSGTISVTNNLLTIPLSAAAAFNDLVFVMFYNYKNLRKAPTKLTSTTVDQLTNTGVISVSGSTITKADSVIFTATNTGLKLNLSEALRKTLSLSSTDTIPSNISIAKIIKVEKVVTASSTDDTVLEVLTTYDVKNTSILNNLYYSDDNLMDTSLLPLEFTLPSTTNNTLNTAPVNLPTIGDKIRITFYYLTDNDLENLSYTRNGTLYTNKRFALINKIYVSSGFKSSLATRLVASSFTQPSLGSRYRVFYDYIAPKQNERISITYNYNKIISDVTFAVEKSRPINADVIVRAAKELLLDLTINVVIDPAQTSSTTTILQNLRDKLNITLSTSKLGQVVDQTTIINDAQSISGITRARILYFNKTGVIGSVTKIQAQNDEYYLSNNIVINTETR